MLITVPCSFAIIEPVGATVITTTIGRVTSTSKPTRTIDCTTKKVFVPTVVSWCIAFISCKLFLNFLEKLWRNNGRNFDHHPFFFWSSDTATNTGSNNGSQDHKAEEKTEFKVGETATFNDKSITVT